MSNLDRTFCASPNCRNECGRQMPPEIRGRGNSRGWVAYGYFCGDPMTEEAGEAARQRFAKAIKNLADR